MWDYPGFITTQCSLSFDRIFNVCVRKHITKDVDFLLAAQDAYNF